VISCPFLCGVVLSKGTTKVLDAMNAILDDASVRYRLRWLLITPEDLERPDLAASLEHYLSSDGHSARIDLVPADPACSARAIEAVGSIREQVADDTRKSGLRAVVGGANALWADVREQTTADQRQMWWVVPPCVCLVLFLALRDLKTCAVLVTTMMFTYLFALGATHLLFVAGLGAPGIDWKVPYFLFILMVAVGVDYNVFLMSRVREEAHVLGLRRGLETALRTTGGLITSAAAISVCGFAAFLFSPLGSLRQLGFALVVGIAADAVLVRPVLVPSIHWLLYRSRADGPYRSVRGPTARADVGTAIGLSRSESGRENAWTCDADAAL